MRFSTLMSFLTAASIALFSWDTGGPKKTVPSPSLRNRAEKISPKPRSHKYTWDEYLAYMGSKLDCYFALEVYQTSQFEMDADYFDTGPLDEKVSSMKELLADLAKGLRAPGSTRYETRRTQESYI
jgi:hypothetical protein